MNKVQEFIHSISMDCVNNFLTNERFAEYYGISEDTALAIRSEGKRLNELFFSKEVTS